MRASALASAAIAPASASHGSPAGSAPNATDRPALTPPHYGEARVYAASIPGFRRVSFAGVTAAPTGDPARPRVPVMTFGALLVLPEQSAGTPARRVFVQR